MAEYHPTHKLAYIMRGVPGSGKSTVAKRLVEHAGLNGRIHSTDSYFTDEHGNYRFDHTKLPEYHTKNLAAFRKSLEDGLDVVVCDNVNIQYWQYEEYIRLAQEHGYIVAIVSLPHPDPEVAAQRNKHGAPVETIRRMIAKWEPDRL